jgi:hypothetical protein
VPQQPRTRDSVSNFVGRATAAKARKRTRLKRTCMALAMAAAPLLWPFLESAFRVSDDLFRDARLLPYFLVAALSLISLLSLLVALTFAHIIRMKVIEFAREAVHEGNLESKDAAAFVANVHLAMKDPTVHGRRRLVA